MTGFTPTSTRWISRCMSRSALWLAVLLPGPVFAQNSNMVLGTLIFESTPIPVDAAPATQDQGRAEPARSATTNNVSVPSPGSNAGPEAFEEAIQVTLEEQGMYSPLLAEQYETLAGLYFNAGRYPEAIASYEDAMHIHKVNKGLFNLDQADLVRKLIRVHTSLGDFEAVDNHRHYLYYLHSKSLPETDPRLVAEKLDWADWNIEAYVKGYRDSYNNPILLSDSVDPARGVRTMNFEVPARPPGVDTSSAVSNNSPSTIPVSINVHQLNSNSVITNAAVTDYNLRSIPYALSNEITINQRLRDAEDIYEEVLEDLERQNSAIQDQMAMHEKLANIAYLLKMEYQKFERVQDQGSIAYNRVNQEFTSDSEMMTNRLYVRTRNALEDIASEFEGNVQVGAQEKAAAYTTLGDLHLSFNRPKRAFAAYEHAYDLLVAAGDSADVAITRLNPAPDTAVPSYGIHPYSRNFFNIPASTQIPYKGYIDVSYDKDAFGQLNAVKVLQESPGTPALVRSALLDHLRQQTFRPKFDGDSGIDQTGINLRYYYFHQ